MSSYRLAVNLGICWNQGNNLNDQILPELLLGFFLFSLWVLFLCFHEFQFQFQFHVLFFFFFSFFFKTFQGCYLGYYRRRERRQWNKHRPRRDKIFQIHNDYKVSHDSFPNRYFPKIKNFACIFTLWKVLAFTNIGTWCLVLPLTL